jgi:hypothetical protein
MTGISIWAMQLLIDRAQLIFDMMGCGKLYNIKIDPCEFNNHFNKPEAAARQSEIDDGALHVDHSLAGCSANRPTNTKYQRPSGPAATNGTHHMITAPHRRAPTSHKQGSNSFHGKAQPVEQKAIDCISLCVALAKSFPRSYAWLRSRFNSRSTSTAKPDF